MRQQYKSLSIKWFVPILLLFCFLFVRESSAQDLEQIGRQKPFAINGTFGLGLGAYTSNGIAPRERHFSYLLNGAPVVSIYGISFPFSVVVSDQQRGFRQPFNQYGISPSYKWITVHAGWQNLQFSQFTLAGYNILGGGIELNPGKLRFGFMYGRFNKAIEEVSTQALSFQTPSYRRTGYSAKLGYGTERNHVDLIMLDAKDDSSSLSHPPTGIKPAQNLVLGIASRFSFLKHFVWDLDAAASVYTRDIGSDTIPGRFLSKVSFLKSFVPLNTSTQGLTAGQTSFGFQNQTFSLKTKYRRVDPDYKSMGAYYFETDVENYSIEGSTGFFKKKLLVTASLGLQHDNLNHDKLSTSHRNISALGISYNTARFGVDLRYSNYGITQDRGLNPIIDTFRVARTNYNLSSLIRYNLGDTIIMHSLVLVANLQSLVDLNLYTSGQNQTNSKTANLSYQLSFLKSGFSLSTNFNYTIANLASTAMVIYGPSLGINKQFDKGKFGLNASFSYQEQSKNSESSGSLFSGSLNGSYRISKRDGANLTVSYLKSNSTDVSLPSFQEFRTFLNLTHTF